MYSQKQRDIDNIESLFFDKVKITEPNYPGAVHDVYIVEDKKDKFVFRFSTKKNAMDNFKTSQILRKYNIPVPDIMVYKIGTKYCEVYRFIDGKTLYEKHKENNLSEIQIRSIYNQLYDICYKISKIPKNEFSHLDKSGGASDSFFQIMNFSPMVIGHSDLHDKNILIDENNNVCAIIDLDGIMKRPFALFLLKLFQYGQKYGYTATSIKDFNLDVYNRNKILNIEQQANLFYKIKYVFELLKLKTPSK